MKDAFHAFVVNGDTNAVNPAQTGTKAAAHYRLEVGAGQSVSRAPVPHRYAGANAVCGVRPDARGQAQEADEFYRDCTPESAARGHDAR